MFDPLLGRYRVCIDNQLVMLRPRNAVLAVGTCVRLVGLSKRDFNGKMAVIRAVDLLSGRYHVDCSAQQLRVKYENVVC